MLFGKMKDSSEYGFGIFEDRFDCYVEIDDDEHMKIIDEANSTGKIIKADSNGYPILVDPPKPTEKEQAYAKINELKLYLNSTDWYVLRYIETEKPIPDDIKNKRADARKQISYYQELLKEQPNGLIIQWGTKPKTDNNAVYTYFPTSFSTTNYKVSATCSHEQDHFTSVAAKETSRMRITVSGGDSPIDWIAIGY